MRPYRLPPLPHPHDPLRRATAPSQKPKLARPTQTTSTARATAAPARASSSCKKAHCRLSDESRCCTCAWRIATDPASALNKVHHQRHVPVRALPALPAAPHRHRRHLPHPRRSSSTRPPAPSSSRPRPSCTPRPCLTLMEARSRTPRRAAPHALRRSRSPNRSRRTSSGSWRAST